MFYVKKIQSLCVSISIILTLGVVCFYTPTYADDWDDVEECEGDPECKKNQGRELEVNDLRGRSKSLFNELDQAFDDQPKKKRSSIKQREKNNRLKNQAEVQRTKYKRERAEKKRAEKKYAEKKRVRDHQKAKESSPKRVRPMPSRDQNFITSVLVLVNNFRKTGGSCGSKLLPPVAPLRLDPLLSKAAQRYAEQMVSKKFFSHKGLDGSHPKSRIEATGYKGKAWGENIALGQETPKEVVASWIKSPGHCSNMLSPLFSELGVGFASDPARPDRLYWVQTFGKPRQ